MTARIVGSGIASLAAAYYLIEDAKVEPSDITIYEEDVLGGAMECHTVPVLSGGPNQPKFAYVLPATRILEREYRCAFELFSHFASISNPNQTLEEDVREFNRLYPYEDATRLLNKAHQVLSSRHLGVGCLDLLRLVRLMFTSERRLDDVTIASRNFTPEFYTSEFWLAWSTMMGPLPEHSAIEMRRYLWRMLHIVPDVATMTTVWRMRMN